jgi:hypothetical protein
MRAQGVKYIIPKKKKRRLTVEWTVEDGQNVVERLTTRYANVCCG